MKLYALESGTFRQNGDSLLLYCYLENAIYDYDNIKRNEERKAYTTITEGLSEYDDTPCVCGFWSGPSTGNTHAHGWRIREILTQD